MFLSCPLAQNRNKDDARICCLSFLEKIIEGAINQHEKAKGSVDNSSIDIRATRLSKRIEYTIYSNYDDRQPYINRIAKIGLHLSTFTNTGRVSWMFKDVIFDEESGDDVLIENLVDTINEDIIPEYYNVYSVDEIEKDRFMKNLRMEETAILNGLNEIIRLCCDSKQCNSDEMNKTYNHVLFEKGSVFNQSMQQVCYVNQVQGWIPTMNEILIINSPTGEQNMNALRTDIKSVCIDLMYIVDKLATLPDNRLLYVEELKSNLYPEVQADIVQKWNMEIQMRKSYYRLKKGLIVSNI